MVRLPSDPVLTFTKLERNLEFLDRDNKEIILAGDTNSDISLLDSSPDNNSSAYNTVSHMAAIFDTFGVKRLIKEPTRVTLNSATLIDHIAVSNPEKIPESGIIKVALSDHYAIYCIRRFMDSFKRHRKTITSRKMKNFNSDKFLYDLCQIDWDQVVATSDNVNSAVEKWSHLLSLVIEKHAPLRTMSFSDKIPPWLTTQLKKLARSRDKLKTAAVKNKSSILMTSYKQMRNKVNNLNKKQKRDYFSNKIASYSGSLKDSWKTINLLLNKRSKTTIIGSLKIDDHDIKEPANIAQAMNEHFLVSVKSFAIRYHRNLTLFCLMSM